jgi:DNA-binding NarL/FixJ family response regulator
MHENPAIDVVLAHFEDLISRGLRSLIAEDAHLRLVAADVSSTVEIRDLTQAFPATRLIVIANRPTAAESRQMLAFGATACLGKAAESRDVLHAVHLASRGLHVLPPAGAHGSDPGGPELLTPREADVLELLQGGRSNAEIAQALHVSVETVRTHARRVYRKLGVSTRRELRSRR